MSAYVSPSAFITFSRVSVRTLFPFLIALTVFGLTSARSANFSTDQPSSACLPRIFSLLYTVRLLSTVESTLTKKNMSTKNLSSLTKLANTLTGKCSKHSGVPAERENLSDYLRRVIRERNLTYRQVAERSGGRISHAAISDIISGKTKGIKSSTISALAKGLGVTEEEIFAVIRGKSPADDPDYKNWKYASLFDDAKKLTPEKMIRFETIMDIARREVTRMLEEQEMEALQRSGRMRPINEDKELPRAKEKKRA